MSQDQPGCFPVRTFLKSTFRRRAKKHLAHAQESERGDGKLRALDFRSTSKSPVHHGGEHGELDHRCSYYSPSCDFSYGEKSSRWTDTESLPSYTGESLGGVLKPEVLKTIESELDELDPVLRELSLRIHARPELAFEERDAHDLLTGFMSEHGFKVTPHYLGLDTAWRAEFTHGKGGRVLGINSEMDALKGIGHACGHNLIAVSGVGVAIAVKVALQAHNVPGKIVLLGTPAEEGGGGKVILIERGGYKDMDACIMCHPGPGLPHSASSGTSNAMQSLLVEYFGRSAHAGAAPWEGTNALDAAFLAYSGISVLRQQIKPDHRVHGVVQGKDWSTNVIPDYAQMRWSVRAPTYTELTVLLSRVKACIEAAGLATACTVSIKIDLPYYDLRQNKALARSFADVVGSRYGVLTSPAGTSASTDFGNVSYEVPAFHPLFAIPTKPQGGNHTAAFAESAATEEAHAAMMVITKGLACTGFRVLDDTGFFHEVKTAFEAMKVDAS